MKKILFLLVLFFLSSVSFADELVLEKGKGVPVCEAHWKNLKTMELYTMVCKRDTYYPQENNITRPTWEKLDLRENQELVKKIHKFLSYGNQFTEMKIMDDERQFEELMDKIYTKSHALYKTAVDIDNDGKAEKVLLYSDGFCMETHVYSRPLLVLDENKNQIDIERTIPLLQNVRLANADLKTKAIESIYRLYDVFFYKNTTYFDKWDAYDWTLSVYKQSKDKVKEVCRYKYIRKP